MTRLTKSIPLKRPFDDGAGGKVTSIVLQEPTGADYFALGSPQTWVRSGGGMALVDNDQAIKAYAERMIVKPDALMAMTQMSVLDAIAVKDGVIGFFQDETTTQSG